MLLLYAVALLELVIIYARDEHRRHPNGVVAAVSWPPGCRIIMPHLVAIIMRMQCHIEGPTIIIIIIMHCLHHYHDCNIIIILSSSHSLLPPLLTSPQQELPLT